MRLVSSNVRTALITLLLVSTPAWAGEGKKIEFTTPRLRGRVKEKRSSSPQSRKRL